MAQHIKIRTSTDDAVHFRGFGVDYTLCGLETAGEEHLDISTGVTVRDKVNCFHCIQVVEFAQKIKRNEWI